MFFLYILCYLKLGSGYVIFYSFFEKIEGASEVPVRAILRVILKIWSKKILMYCKSNIFAPELVLDK